MVNLVFYGAWFLVFLALYLGFRAGASVDSRAWKFGIGVLTLVVVIVLFIGMSVLAFIYHT